MSTEPMDELSGTVEARAFFADSVLGLAVLDRVGAILAGLPDVEVRATKSQVAFRRRRGFAYLWRPGQYLRRTDVEVVLSIALDRLEVSPRFKEVAHPARTVWMHHLEIRDVDELDDEVGGWLLEAAERAG